MKGEFQNCPHCGHKIDFVRQINDLASMWLGAASGAIGYIVCDHCGEYAFGLDLYSCKDVETEEIEAMDPEDPKKKVKVKIPKNGLTKKKTNN